MESRCPEKSSVHECIEHYCGLDPNRLCCSVRAKGNWISYSREQFWNLVCRYSDLFAHSCAEQTLILFSKKLDIHLLASYIGAMRSGCLPAMISLPSSKTTSTEYRKRIDHIRQITAFGAIFTDSPEKDHFGQTDDVIVLTTENIHESFAPESRARVNDALVQFSSGSTGLQKGVVLTHEAVISHMRMYSAYLRLNENDKIISWLPLYHDMGLIACYLMPLMCGIPFHQFDPFDWVLQPDLLLNGIDEKKATICYLPNFAYHVLIDKGRNHDLSSIRLWVNCSEPARHKTHDEFRRKFPSVREDALSVCYALAENTFAVSQSLPWDSNQRRTLAQRDVTSCGRIIPGVEVRICESEDHVDGEIAIKSPSLFSRFVTGDAALVDGFYLTGDLGFIEDGELFITGRKKDLIIVYGKNIYPQDVEYAATGVTGVYPGRVAAFGVWNEGIGSEDLIVLVELQEGNETGLTKAKVLKAVQEEAGIVPKRVCVLPHMSLVKTSSGKISRARNKDLYLTGSFNLQ